MRNYAENNFNLSIKFEISTIFTQFKLEREKITLQKQSLILYRINLVKFISIPLQIFFFSFRRKMNFTLSLMLEIIFNRFWKYNFEGGEGHDKLEIEQFSRKARSFPASFNDPAEFV